MSRRAIGLLLTLVLGILMAPVVADAQPAAKVPRIGFFSSDSPASDRGLTVAHIVEGGHPDSVQEPSRREMAQAMFRMFGTLAHP